MWKRFTVTGEKSPAKEVRSVLDEVLLNGAREMLQRSIENEVADLKRHNRMTDEKGHRLAVRNGYFPERYIVSGIGPVSVRQPRVDDRKVRKQGMEPFNSRILTRYLRRVPSIDNLIPVLYLKGVSTGDFSEALAAILGPSAAGLSATNIVRLKASWEADYRSWSKRDLSDKKYVYFWADGINFNVHLDDERTCILVIIGADKEGNKELVLSVTAIVRVRSAGRSFSLICDVAV